MKKLFVLLSLSLSFINVYAYEKVDINELLKSPPDKIQVEKLAKCGLDSCSYSANVKDDNEAKLIVKIPEKTFNGIKDKRVVQYLYGAIVSIVRKDAMDVLINNSDQTNLIKNLAETNPTKARILIRLNVDKIATLSKVIIKDPKTEKILAEYDYFVSK